MSAHHDDDKFTAEEMKQAVETGIVPSMWFYAKDDEPLDKEKVSEIVEQFKEIVDQVVQENPETPRSPGNDDEAEPSAKRPRPYVTIQASSRTIDCLRLRKLPELPTDEKKKTEFLEWMFGLYPEGIQGWGNDYAKVTEKQLFGIMRTILENNQKEQIDNPDYIYYALYCLFPQSWSQRELTEIFPKLCKKFAEEGFEGEPLEPWRPMEQEEEQKCVECRTRLCAFHGISTHKATTEAGHYVFVPLPGNTQSAPCSSECFKQMSKHRVRKLFDATDADWKKQMAPALFTQSDIDEIEDISKKLLVKTFLKADKMDFCEFFENAVCVSDSVANCKQAYKCLLAVATRNEHPRLTKRPLTYDQKASRFAALYHREEKMEPGKVPLAKGPCSHDGECSPDNENCFCGDGYCSSMCTCAPNCKRAFPGCKCKPGKCRGKECPCFFAQWECNPETCRNCNCGEDTEGSCSNTGIAMMKEKHVFTGPSSIAGTGLFAGEKIEKDELVIEYVGEKLYHDESERRGQLCDYLKLSYLFSGPTGDSIDAARIGNKARYANHSTNPNMYVKHIAVMGTMRIGFYAKKNLEEGDELTIDYQYKEDQFENIGFIAKKDAPGTSNGSSS